MSIAAGRGVRRKKKKQQQPRLNRDQLITGGSSDKIAASWYEWLMSSLMYVMARLLSIISFGYLQLPIDDDVPTQSLTQQNISSKRNKKRSTLEGYYDNIAVVGLDCEMVGGGRMV